MIREAKPKDAPDVYRISLELHALSRYRDIPPCEEKIKRTIAMLIGSPTQFCWVSERGGEITGILLAVIDEIVWSRKKEAHDVWFYVNERGRGDGARLASKFIQWAKRRGVALYGLTYSSGFGDMNRFGAMCGQLGLERHGVIYAQFGGTQL